MQLTTLLGILLFLGIASVQVLAYRRKQRKAVAKLQKAIEQDLAPQSLHPDIDPEKCLGCGSCTKACPEGDILQLINHRSVLVAPQKCVGHGECELVCPAGAITLVVGTKSRGVDIPRITGHYETNVAGLYIAGELGGMGLIRNATRQGTLAAEHAIANLPKQRSAKTDLLIIGAGPAGFAASLKAIEAGIRYLCIDQNTFGGTINNFPRQKVVMSQPLELPVAGRLKFPKNKVSKEKLLEAWRKIAAEASLKVRENISFQKLEPKGEWFEVTTSRGVVTAHKVLLCLGVGGSPRKLGLAGEDSSKVCYSLVDAGQYRSCHVAVVGGGNSAVEAAVALAAEELDNEVTLLVRKELRCNDDNLKALTGLERRKRLRVWKDASVAEIAQEHLLINRRGEKVELPNQHLFVLAGTDSPHAFLMSLGIAIEKKFGERLGNA